MTASPRSTVSAALAALLGAWLVASVFLVSIPARASELLMFERAGCIWCARWNRDVGPIYDKTDEAKVLPLRRIDIDRGTPADVTLTAPVRYTPTFVVIDDGREIGRITGYINDESFWGLLGVYASKIAKSATHKPLTDKPPVPNNPT